MKPTYIRGDYNWYIAFFSIFVIYCFAFIVNKIFVLHIAFAFSMAMTLVLLWDKNHYNQKTNEANK